MNANVIEKKWRQGVEKHGLKLYRAELPPRCWGQAGFEPATVSVDVVPQAFAKMSLVLRWSLMKRRKRRVHFLRMESAFAFTRLQRD